MSIRIGIDSGGTFTDGVVIDIANGKICSKSKVPTIHDNLIISIKQCLDSLDIPPGEKIDLISLSTTLATNAVVEGKGSAVGVILVGHEAQKNIPSPYVFTVEGGHDISGVPLNEVNKNQAVSIIKSIKDKVEAFAVSSLSSIRNPEHELELKNIIRKITGYPVVCGHELTSMLGVHERTVTAVLNAKLLPVINNLIMAVQKALKDKKISAPLMIVKGDGSLFSAEVALERPIESLLSGPASSINGAMHLSGLENGLVVDMGGTTTDVAYIEQGMANLNEKGAYVGGWLTRVKALNISTFGIGGDSYLQILKDKSIGIGPNKVTPISLSAVKFPSIKKELDELLKQTYTYVRHQPFDFLISSQYCNTADFEDMGNFNAKLMEEINHVPHSLHHISKSIGVDLDFYDLNSLIERRIIEKISFTPTDLSVDSGKYLAGDQEAASKVLKIFARTLNMPEKKCLELLWKEINKKLITCLLSEVIDRQELEKKACTNCNLLIEHVLSPNRKDYEIYFKLNKPIIAVGAPVHVFFPDVVSLLKGNLIIPEHADIANAVGAAVGKVSEQIVVLIRPIITGGYSVFAPWGKKDFKYNELDAVKQKVINEAKNYVRNQVKKQGGVNVKVSIDLEDFYTNPNELDTDGYFIESKVKVKAIGLPLTENI